MFMKKPPDGFDDVDGIVDSVVETFNFTGASCSSERQQKQGQSFTSTLSVWAHKKEVQEFTEPGWILKLNSVPELASLM
jgi:hypothetical protein